VYASDLAARGDYPLDTTSGPGVDAIHSRLFRETHEWNTTDLARSFIYESKAVGSAHGGTMPVFPLWRAYYESGRILFFNGITSLGVSMSGFSTGWPAKMVSVMLSSFDSISYGIFSDTVYLSATIAHAILDIVYRVALIFLSLMEDAARKMSNSTHSPMSYYHAGSIMEVLKSLPFNADFVNRVFTLTFKLVFLSYVWGVLISLSGKSFADYKVIVSEIFPLRAILVATEHLLDRHRVFPTARDGLLRWIDTSIHWAEVLVALIARRMGVFLISLVAITGWIVTSNLLAFLCPETVLAPSQNSLLLLSHIGALRAPNWRCLAGTFAFVNKWTLAIMALILGIAITYHFMGGESQLASSVASIPLSLIAQYASLSSNASWLAKAIIGRILVAFGVSRFVTGMLSLVMVAIVATVAWAWFSSQHAILAVSLSLFTATVAGVLGISWLLDGACTFLFMCVFSTALGCIIRATGINVAIAKNAFSMMHVVYFVYSVLSAMSCLYYK